MKNLSRILTIVLCCAPFAYANAAGTVATTAGSNLTAYNPSNVNNNQWASLSNARSDPSAGTAKANFGNCNSVVLRCAQPKCGNGGCADMNVAAGIVMGCVQSNENCKQYGNDLINYMAAQLVASSTAKANAQSAAAAQQAQYEQQQQMQNMQAQMQQQMMQMQQQNNETVQQLQNALAQQAEQNQQAIENMRAAATEAAKVGEAGVSAYQQEAIDRGVSNDVLERQKIGGQVLTQIEDAEISLKELKTTMMGAFDYAECDARGNNCGAPKRIKKWRDLATQFIDPYENVVDKLYYALETAAHTGIDLSQIYMMLSDSCHSWAQYMCEKGARIDYSGKVPMSCPNDTESAVRLDACTNTCKTGGTTDQEGYTTFKYDEACKKNCETQNGCRPCTFLKSLTDGADVYEGWIDPSVTENNNGVVVACASNALDASKLFGSRVKNKNGAGMVNINELDIWLNQTEPDIKNTNGNGWINYCYADKDKGKKALEKAMLSKSIGKNVTFCVESIPEGNKQETADKSGDCGYISRVFGICDTHAYNYGKPENPSSQTDRDEMNEIIKLKITVASQQMYKQYEYLASTLKRLKIMLEKSVLTANLEAAGGNSDSGSSSGLLGASNKASQYRNCAGKDPADALSCLRENYSTLSSQTKEGTKCTNQTALKQIGKDIKVMNSLLDDGKSVDKSCETVTSGNCENCLTVEYSGGLSKLNRQITDDEYKRHGSYR